MSVQKRASWTPIHHESSSHAKKEAALREESVSSMNISTHGVYFASDQKVREGLLVQLHLKMPKEIVGDEVQE